MWRRLFSEKPPLFVVACRLQNYLEKSIFMKEILYTTSAVSVGGRDGHVKSEDGLIDMDLRLPVSMGGKGGTANPESLFASGYSACFNGALNLAARLKRIRVGETTVKITVTLGKDLEGNLQLGAKIEANVPGVSSEVAMELVADAHRICPYSRAIRGNVDVELHPTNNG